MSMFLDSQSLQDLASKYELALKRLDSWGIRVSRHSRLANYQSRLREAGASARLQLSESEIEQLAFDMREVSEVVEIVSSFDLTPNSEELVRLRLLHRDAEHPDRGSSTKAREAQFELYVRAVFKHSGFDCTMPEPDLWVDAASVRFPVAAKRPSSAARFDDNVRDAVSQVGRTGELGLVAISLDQVIRPPGAFPTVASRALLVPETARLTDAFAAERLDPLRRRLDGRQVVGVLLSAALPYYIQSESSLGLGRYINLLAIPGEDGRHSDITIAAWSAVERFRSSTA